MSQAPAILALMALLAYLIGSISFAVWVSHWMGLPDPHSYGSGNPGATNVLRTGNRQAAIWTLLGDTGKGVLAVALAVATAKLHQQGMAGLACGASCVYRALVSHMAPIPGRQRRGHCRRRAFDASPMDGYGHGVDLAHHSDRLSLLLPGCIDRSLCCAWFCLCFPWWLRLSCGCERDEHLAGAQTSPQHREALAG